MGELAGRRPVDSDRCATFADGLAVRVAIPLAVAELNALAQRFELVSEASSRRAVRDYAAAGIRVEGAAAAPLALALREELPSPLVLIVTGRNIDDALYDRILTARNRRIAGLCSGSSRRRSSSACSSRRRRPSRSPSG